MYTCGFRINANLVKEGSFHINAKLVKEEIILCEIKCFNTSYWEVISSVGLYIIIVTYGNFFLIVNEL